MLAYLLKRLLAMIPTLIGITLLTFLIVRMAPGDPVAAQMGGQRGGPSANAEGGGGDSGNRQADAIKAKKKLLGMMEEAHEVFAWDIAEIPDAGRAAAQSSDGSARSLVEMERGVELPQFEEWPRVMALSPDGTRLYAGLRQGAVVAIDVASGQVATTYPPHAEHVRAIAVSDDGSKLVTADANGIIHVVNTADGSEAGAEQQLDQTVRDVLFLPSGDRFVTAAGSDGGVRVHDVATGVVVETMLGHSNFVGALAISADGTRLWSGGYDRKLREWDLGTGKLTRVVTEAGQAITDIAVAPDESYVAAACEDRNLYIVPLADGAEVTTLDGHFDAVIAVAIHPDGRTIFTGGRDETIRTWDKELGAQTAQVPDNVGRVESLLVSADGNTLWSAGESWQATSLVTQYLGWAWKMAQLDFGRSFTDDQPVIEKIQERLPVTLGLNFFAILIIYGVSIPLGVMAAVKRGSLFDTGTSLLVFMLWSMPSFWVATLLIMTFSSRRNLDWFPSVGLHDTNQADLSYLAWLQDWGAHMVLPMIVLVYAGFASLSRYARTSVLDAISQDYVRTARAKGLAERVVIFKHALRNSLIAIVTLLGTLLPAMIGGSVIVEFIFSIRGMGLLGFNAILSRDYPVIMAVTTFGGLLTLLGLLISDIMYTVVDPRITHK